LRQRWARHSDTNSQYEEMSHAVRSPKPFKMSVGSYGNMTGGATYAQNLNDMTKTFNITLLAVCICAAAQEKTRNIAADIRAVTVFLEGAQVSRKTSVNLEPGVTTLSLSGIAPGIREQSIQVSITAPAKIMSVSFNVNYLDELQ